MKLEHPYTIAEVAKMAGWSYWRMKRHLERLHDELGQMLLRDNGVAGNGRRVTVTLAALKRAAPDLVIETRDYGAEIDELRDEVKQLEELQMKTATRVGELSRAVKTRRAA